MRKVVDDPRLIYKCCKLYYEDDYSQQQIADTLGVSRVSVSRMLCAGREAGMVKIQVVSPNHLTYNKLEQELEQLYGCLLYTSIWVTFVWMMVRICRIAKKAMTSRTK